MAKRGRKSSDELSTAVLIGADTLPITASDKLTCEQSALFSEIVGSLPGKFFSQEQAPLVDQLCRHIITARRLAIVIDRLEKKDADVTLDEYWKALAERRKETAQITSLMRALRLTNQSRYRPERAGDLNNKPKPWEA